MMCARCFPDFTIWVCIALVGSKAACAINEEKSAVLVLKEIEGYAHAEIAELLGISEGASRVRLTRALKRLRDELEDGP